MNKKVIFIRVILFTFAIIITSCFPKTVPQNPTLTPTNRSAPPSNFVTVQNGKFMLEGHPYYFVGTNFWQGMNLGVDNPSGDRSRLVKELDQLQSMGVTNLRGMAASGGPNTEPHRMIPALMTSPGFYDKSVLD